MPRKRHSDMPEAGPVDADALDPEGFTVLVARYLESLRVANKSPATVGTRELQLKPFVAWCAERDMLRPDQLTRELLERYQSHLYHRRKAGDAPLAVVTQYGQLVTVRLFFRWLVREKFLLFNPASEIELPKLPRQLPRTVLSVAEAETVLAAIDLGKSLGLRDRAIVETLYSTGMRRKELAALTLHDIDFGRGTVMIRQGKGGKDRVTPIGERALLWLRKYFAELRPHLVRGADPGVLFVHQDGSAITAPAVSRLMRDAIRKAALGKDGSCHVFRHTAATLMLENGADIRFIQAMLGHETLQTTQIYTRVSIQKLKAVHDAPHPGRAASTAGAGEQRDGWRGCERRRRLERRGRAGPGHLTLCTLAAVKRRWG